MARWTLHPGAPHPVSGRAVGGKSEGGGLPSELPSQSGGQMGLPEAPLGLQGGRD